MVCSGLWMPVDVLYLSQVKNAKIQKSYHEGDCDKSPLPESPEDQAIHSIAPLNAALLLLCVKNNHKTSPCFSAQGSNSNIHAGSLLCFSVQKYPAGRDLLVHDQMWWGDGGCPGGNTHAQGKEKQDLKKELNWWWPKSIRMLSPVGLRTPAHCASPLATLSSFLRWSHRGTSHGGWGMWGQGHYWNWP